MNHNDTRTKTISKTLLAFIIAAHILPLFNAALVAETTDTDTPSSSLSSESSEVVLSANSEEESSSSSESVFLSPSSPEPSSASETEETATTTDSTHLENTEESTATSTSAEESSTSTATTTEATYEDTGSFTSSSTTVLSSTSTVGSSTDTVSSSTFETSFSTSAEESATTTLEIEGSLPQGTTTIATGDSIALANLLNIVNTNLVNSTGSIVLQNLADGSDGDLDLRTSTGASSSTCTLLACNGIDSITTQTNASSSIDNVIDLAATSGENAIITAENAVIQTGTSLAGLNLINVANTNLVDSTYLLLGLNAFNDVHGDIVFPSLSNFFNSQSTTPLAGTINLNQSGEITNNLDVQASAGGNQALEAQSGVISTGNALSSTNVYNALNGTYIGGGSVQILLKVSGAWMGNLFGTPDGVGFVDNGSTKVLNLSTPGSLSSAINTATANILSTSTALINNQINMIAESGLNEIKDTAHAVIETGDAVAAANIINIANTNVIGRNWILAIINIFGNFHGNIAFGRPDLWLGAQVHGESPVQNGSPLTYTLTISNRGDSPATNAVVVSDYDEEHLTIADASVPFTDSNGKLSFSMGTFAPGESKEIIFHAHIKNAPQGFVIGNTSTVTERETDNNMADNTDTVGIQTHVDNALPGGGSSSGGSNGNNTPTLPSSGIASATITVQVQRMTASSTLSGAGTTGEQTIIIRNLTSHTLPGATFEDILIDPQGKEVQRQNYNLGDIKPYEEITISYDISFGDGAKEGTYFLSSELRHSPAQTYTFTSNGSIAFKKVTQALSAQVLGVATTTPKTITKQVPALRAAAVQSPDEQGSILGAFVQSFSPEIAYAEDAGKDMGGIDWNYWIVVLIIILLIIAALLYRRYLVERERSLT